MALSARARVTRRRLDCKCGFLDYCSYKSTNSRASSDAAGYDEAHIERNHSIISRWLPFVAFARTASIFHGQPFSRAHLSVSSWPPHAAALHVFSSHGAPFSRAHLSVSRWPPNAAA